LKRKKINNMPKPTINNKVKLQKLYRKTAFRFAENDILFYLCRISMPQADYKKIVDNLEHIKSSFNQANK